MKRVQGYDVATSSTDAETARPEEDSQKEGTLVVLPERASLLGCPREIRDMVYKYIIPELDEDHYTIHREDNHQQPGITRSCRQLRAETIEDFPI